MYFGNRLLTDDWLKEVDLVDLDAKGLVTLVRIKEPKKTEEVVETGPETDLASAAVPGDKLSAANLWTAYGVKKADTIIIADQWGNEYRRTKSQKLEALVIKMTRDNKKLQKKLKTSSLKAEAALGKGDLKTASKELLKVFKAKKFGWTQTVTAAELYTQLLEKGREQIKAAGTDADALGDLKKDLKGTGLDDEIAEVLKGIS